MNNINTIKNTQPNKFIDAIDYSAIFMLLYTSSSFFMRSLSGVIIMSTQFMMTLLALFFAVLSSRTLKVSSNLLLKTVFLILILVWGDFNRGEAPKQTLINISAIILAFLYGSIYGCRDFLKKYTNIMYFLAVSSLVVYILYVLMPQLFVIFPDIENNAGSTAKNVFISTIYGSSIIRNQSVFWEPGAFQTYLNLALVFELFYFKQFNGKRLTIYLVALLTTFSTTGYIVAFAIIYTYIFQSFLAKNIDKNQLRFILSMITIVFLLVIWFINSDLPVIERVFGKLEDFGESSGGHQNSAQVRYSAIVEPFRAFLQNPFWGMGTTNMYYYAYFNGYNMNTCTFINWFAYFGLWFALVLIFMYVKFVKQLSNSRFIVCMLFIIMFLVTISENYYRNPSILTFAFLQNFVEGETVETRPNQLGQLR